MFDWNDTTFILTYWNKIDMPIVPKNVKVILDSENIRMNGLTAQGKILGGKVEFLEEENPATDLLAGIIRFHTKWTPPVPAQEIDNTSEYDVTNFQNLFSES